MSIRIDSSTARSSFFALLRFVRSGGRVTITFRGEPAAELIPVETARRKDAARAVEELRAFMHVAQKKQSVDVRGLIDDGRP